MEEKQTNTVIIQVQGEELEVINVELSAAEVKSIYLQRKELQKEVQALEKKIKDMESIAKYNTSRMEKAESEVKQANVLLSALGVAFKTNEEESWRQEELSVATRIALYIANKTNN